MSYGRFLTFWGLWFHSDTIDISKHFFLERETMADNRYFIYAETDDKALLDVWGSETPEGDDGHDFFLVYDENDGEPKPAAGRDITKKFRLMFDAPEAEVSNFRISLEKAGFGPVFSELVAKPSPDDTPGEMAF
jgi:hypothetical protein